MPKKRVTSALRPSRDPKRPPHTAREKFDSNIYLTGKELRGAIVFKRKRDDSARPPTTKSKKK